LNQVGAIQKVFETNLCFTLLNGLLPVEHFLFYKLMKNVLIQFNQKPIAVYPIYIKITGSVNAGLLLSQIMYWYGAVNGRTFYKSDAEIMDETMLSVNELRHAKARLKQMSFIKITLHGVPAKTHYTIDDKLLFSEINKCSLVESTKLDKSKPRNYNSEINETNTENTTENTTKNTTEKGCENDFSLPDLEVKNPFSRQSYHDALNTDTDPKESCAKEKVQREPSETYLCFSAFASTYERLAGVTYPSDKGNYIMTAKDGANCKKLVTWLKKVSASEQASEDMVTMFTTAAWQISDKWLKANFTISNIYSQANNIYTKFLYASPLAKEKKRQEEIDKLVNEFTI
jgi:hypothetical protein